MPPTSSNLPPPQVPATPQPHEYEFIVNPGAPSKRFSFPFGGGTLGRLALVLGGLLVLIIIVVVVKGLLAPKTSYAPFITIAQDQQELIHLSTNATQQQGLSTTSQNFAITAQLSLTSAESQLLTYLKNNGQKVSTKVLGQKVSASLDSQLTTAAGDSTYDATFQQIMQSQLTVYSQAMKQAYNGAGPRGKALLNADYNGAQLLLKQLGSPAS